LRLSPDNLVIDLGCGTGNSLPVLAARFPKAEVVGVDSSPAMLEKASSAGLTTQLADIATMSSPELMDVIFIYAALQWMSDHAVLFPK
jgi:trans-aconitate 2-methyltransferase